MTKLYFSTKEKLEEYLKKRDPNGILDIETHTLEVDIT